MQLEPPDNQMRPPSPQNENVDKEMDEQVDVETRRILSMQCDLEESDKKEGQLSLRILLRFEVLIYLFNLNVTPSGEFRVK